METSSKENIYTRKELLKAEVFKETVLNNKYMYWKPTEAQARLMLQDEKEILWGGSAGPGKSVGLLMAATQYVEVPYYSALLLRKTFKQLKESKALMDLSKMWFAEAKNKELAHWSEKDFVWTFPSGAKIKFGYLDSENDKYNFQGAEYQFIGFDELTQFDEQSYLYLYSRLRKTKDNPVPLRIWSTSNPGGTGHEWVKRRFVPDDYKPKEHKHFHYKEHEEYDGSLHTTLFMPAFIDENPYLDKTEYLKNLGHLDAVTRQQLMDGDWTARHEGSMFKREWFRIIEHPPYLTNIVRYWDCAATEKKFGDGRDPDYTVGLLLGELNGEYYVLDLVRFRESPKVTEDKIRLTAEMDELRFRGRTVKIWMEEERGSSGKQTISHYQRNVLNGFLFRGHRSTGDKLERATKPSAAAQSGLIYVSEAPWNRAFFDELEVFPNGAHDDIVDAFSGAFNRAIKHEAWLISG